MANITIYAADCDVFYRIISTAYGNFKFAVFQSARSFTTNDTVTFVYNKAYTLNCSAPLSRVSTSTYTPIPTTWTKVFGDVYAQSSSNGYSLGVTNSAIFGISATNNSTVTFALVRDFEGHIYTISMTTFSTDGAAVIAAATSERWGEILFEYPDYSYGSATTALSTDKFALGDALYNNSENISTDPYDNIGTSDTGGGGGTGTAGVTSDDIGIPSLPTYDATDTGFITLYRPSTTELKNLAAYMWSSAFDIDTFKKLFADPMEAILGLSKLGVNAPAGGAQTVTVGNFSTGVSMTTLSEQYFEIDCGTLNVEEIKESYLSFSPYTKVSIYLPFIGVQQLNVDDFMSGSVSLTYKFDALSGSCLALITCAKSNKGVASLNSVLYSFMGQCSATIPVNGNDFANMISSAVTIGASIAGIAATGGAAAPLAVPTMASAAVNALKPTIEHSGSISGAGAILGVKKPYLIFERPRYCIPSNQNKYIGYPSFITENVGDLSGYTVFEDVKITGNSHATTGEIAEIESIMKEGVYL